MILNFASLLCTSLFVGAWSLNYNEAIYVIKANVKSYDTLQGGGLCDKNDCCTISETNSCDLDSFAKDKSMLVLPGGETRCIFSTSTEFAFQVIPGDTDKLLFYFQGGGACWDKASTVTIPMCTTDSSPSGLNGIFDRTNAANTYRDYTVVQVLYCSGDIHGTPCPLPPPRSCPDIHVILTALCMDISNGEITLCVCYVCVVLWTGGNTVRPYDDSAGEPVQQKGLANAQAVLDWVVQQQQNGKLAASLSDLVVMGCSAGSIGAQLWSNQITSSIQWKKVLTPPHSPVPLKSLLSVFVPFLVCFNSISCPCRVLAGCSGSGLLRGGVPPRLPGPVGLQLRLLLFRFSQPGPLR